MGLDLVELVMAVEEEFGIELPDDTAANLVTPALLTDFILTRVKTAEQSVCLSRKAFYALRRVVMKEFGCQRAKVKPDTPIETLIPRTNRRAAWQRTKDVLAAEEWPELRRPVWVSVLLGAAFAASALGFWRLGLAGWAAALTGTVPWLLLFRATQPFRTEFPGSCRTAGELAHFLVAHAPKLFEPQGRAWTREEVAQTVRRLTIGTIGVKPKDYREDARFVEDFGAG